jgi:FAD:protein FMN transferase
MRSCWRRAELVADDLVRRARPLLGTLVEIALPCEAAIVAEAGFAAIARVHALMSFHEAGSDVSRINAAQAGTRVRVDTQTIAVLRAAETLNRGSGGIFDITIGRGLVRDGFLPKLEGEALAVFDGTARDIEIVDDHHIRCHRRVLIDLGGIAKGYAVDQAVAALIEAGVSYGIVNAGGDLRVFGAAAQTVHIRDGSGALIASLALEDAALASSANLVGRWRVRGETRTPHIGPDGKPVLINHSISVMAATCMIADAMTKVAMTDPDLADRMLADHQGCVIRFPEQVVAA